MRQLATKINALDPSVEEIKGHGKRITKLEVFINTVAKTGQTATKASMLTCKVGRTQESGDALPEIVSSVRMAAFQALNNYLEGYADETFTEAGTVDTGYDIPFDILPLLKPGIPNGIMLQKSDSLSFEQAQVSSTTFSTCQMKIYREESSLARSFYAPIYHEIPYSADTAGEKPIGENLAYLLIFPPSAGWTTEPGLIMVKDGDRILQRYESWDDLLQSTKRRGSMTELPDYGIIDVSNKGAFRNELHNNCMIEMLSGSGTCSLVKVNVRFTSEDEQLTRASVEGATLEAGARSLAAGGSAEMAMQVITPSEPQSEMLRQVQLIEEATRTVARIQPRKTVAID